MGAVSALLLAAAFSAAPAPDAFRFDGPSASATVDGGRAAVRVGGAVREGAGSAFVRGEDRVRAPEMTYGDAGELWMRVRSGGEVYRVELDAVGFPPAAALPRETKRGWWWRVDAAPRRPEGGVEGGVVLGRMVNGGSGLGVRDMPARRAAVALWGIGRLYRNDELVAPRARILAQVVPAEVVSKEGSLRAREPRPELDVFVDQVPAEVSQAGFVHFVLEGASVAEPPRAAVARRAAAPSRPETKEERLARRPTAEEMWNSGATMISWRDEEAPAPSGTTREPGGTGTTGYGPAASGANAPGAARTSETQMSVGAPAPSGTTQEPGGTGATAYGSVASGANAPGAAQASGATAPSGSAAPAAVAYNPWMSPGTQTVIQPPPPLMAVPATPNTAPIQYETGQNGGTIGNGLIGGGGTGAGATAAYGGSGVTTGIFNQATPPPSGVFAGMSPSSIPTQASPAAPPTPLPPTPQPINAQPAPIPGATAPVPTQLPAQTQPAPLPPVQSQATPAAQGVPGLPAVPAPGR